MISNKSSALASIVRPREAAPGGLGTAQERSIPARGSHLRHVY
ncbi:hypothetical protein SAMN06309944_2271 [Micrococcales bacterium KH10]|nr:hypothetical protein SAMN06309944_2271 [Micrococcales bacterium KH10]